MLRRFRRRRSALALAAALLLLLVFAAVAWWLKHPLPRYAGRFELPVLDAPVTLDYGPHAVPSVAADSLPDLMRAQGFVVARERFWQMDLIRRLAGGRLAELFGEGALLSDRFYRTIGLDQSAERSFAALGLQWRRLLNAYAEGVNAYRATAIAESRLPLEYRLLGIEPTAWRATDSLLVGAYMAWLNGSNLAEELVFLRLAQRLGPERAQALFPVRPGQPAPGAAPPVPVRVRPSAAGPDAGDAAVSPLPLGQDGRSSAASLAASNAWAVTGARSLAGPLLANDPHLPAVMPGTWFLIELDAPGYHATGASIPGLPLVLTGHNQHLAWGITAAVADTQDLFLERLGEDGLTVMRPEGQTEQVQRRVVEIPVAGWAKPDVLEIRSTRHGVLINELIAVPGANPAGLTAVQIDEGVALRSVVDQPDRSFAAFFELGSANTLAEAREAVRGLGHVALNVLIAHRDGRIGWQVGGLLPQRGRGNGLFPSPGWEPGYGWDGYRPEAALPGLSDPPDGLLVNANNAMAADQSHPPISQSWLAPFRARRIEQLLKGLSPVGVDAMARIQADRVSLEAQRYLEALRRQMPALKAANPEAAEIAASRLLGWDGSFADNSRAAAFFILLRPALYQALYADELGSDLAPLMALEQRTYGPLAEAIRADQSAFWDDQSTPGRTEGPVQVWAKALHSASAAYAQAVPEVPEPTLAQLRQLTFLHAFVGVPVLGRLFNVGPMGRGGDNGTIDVSIASLASPREIGNVPSLRLIMTPAQWSESRVILPLGQSGHRLSRYRTDQLAQWQDGETFQLPWGGPAEGQLLGRLVLRPATR